MEIIKMCTWSRDGVPLVWEYKVDCMKCGHIWNYKTNKKNDYPKCCPFCGARNEDELEYTEETNETN